MHIPVLSPWLPGYIDVTQTVLIILTMAKLLRTDLIWQTHSYHHNGEKVTAFPLRSGIRQRCSLLPLLFNIVLEVLVQQLVQQEKK